MTAKQIAALEEGRKRAAAARRRGAVKRVRAYRAWLDAGSITRLIPEIPTDHDFDLAGDACRFITS